MFMYKNKARFKHYTSFKSMAAKYTIFSGCFLNSAFYASCLTQRSATWASSLQECSLNPR